MGLGGFEKRLKAKANQTQLVGGGGFLGKEGRKGQKGERAGGEQKAAQINMEGGKKQGG